MANRYDQVLTCGSDRWGKNLTLLPRNAYVQAMIGFCVMRFVHIMTTLCMPKSLNVFRTHIVEIFYQIWSIFGKNVGKCAHIKVHAYLLA